MADETPKTEEKEKAKEEVKKEAQEAPQVCSLSIPTIIAALHQTALAHSNAASKNATITNSALEGDGKDAKLASAGEHIISVIPNEGGVLQKADAIALLSEYVQWFVGPVLKKKLNDSTVTSLTEAPGSEKNESKRFMSFGKFLMLEAEEDDLAAADELFSGEEGGEEDKSTEGEKKEEEEEDKKPEEDKKDGKPEDGDGSKEGEVDETKESKTGYYIAYNLKVEGLPQTALKDAMKKFAKTLFDDMKITASGLFGGGDSFTIKDVKDAVNDIFGPIDPDDLKDKVKKEIDTKYPDQKVDELSIRDKTSLISDLGKNIDAAQKQKISSADYSLWIKVNEYSPTKPIFNTRIIADIVQSSITGLFKKFKNKITKNDVIFIEDYADIHSDTKSLEQLNRSVPTPQELTKLMLARNMNVAKMWAQIEKDIDKIAKNKQIKNSVLASGCVKIWEEWKKNHKDDPEAVSSDPMDRTTIQKYFQPFIDKYTKFYDENKGQEDLHESLRILRALNNNEDFKKFVLESMYMNAFSTNVPSNGIKRDTLKHDIMSILLEEEPSEGEGKDEKDNEELMSDEDIENISNAFTGKLVKIAKEKDPKAVNPFAKFGKSADILAWLEERGLATSDVKSKLEQFPYAGVNFVRLPYEENGKLKGGTPGHNAYTSDNVKSSLESAISGKVTEPVIEYEATSSNGVLKYNNTKIPSKCKIWVLLFDMTEQGGEGSKDASKGGSGGNGEGDSKTKRDDVYIIPLPGIKYKDKEHEGTYA